MYLGSGPLRDGSFSEWMKKLGNATVIPVDLKIGGYAHDISSPPVAVRLREVITDPRCKGLLASIPCKTWSPARSAPAEGALQHSRPLRDLIHPEGFRGEDGELPSNVQRANDMADLVAELGRVIVKRGGRLLVESTPSRHTTAAHPLPGRETHAGMFDYPAFVRLINETGCRIMHFDQCMTRDEPPSETPEKKTALLYSANIETCVFKEFAPLMCSHAPCTHPSMLGLDEHGNARASRWENYSSDMNARLARCFTWQPSDVRIKTNDAPTHAEPASNATTPFGHDPLIDWDSFYRPSNWSYDDEPVPSPLPANSAVRGVADQLGREFSRSLYATGIDGQCFAAPRDPDTPSLREAMNGPERKEWEAARQAEFENLRRHDAFEEVVEDTLPGWNAAKQRAYEVVSILDVLRKKYINNVFDKFKARWVYDGRAQKATNVSGDHPLDTFAPTVRHSTHKMLTGNAAMRGAAPTTLCSEAYLDRISKEVLPKPLSEYPWVPTPCTDSIQKDYEAALESRHDVDPALRERYPRVVGKAVYAMPACRVDCAYAIGMCTRCLTFPTQAMMAQCERCIVYMAQRAKQGVTFNATGARTDCHAYSDSDWQVGSSTSGWCIKYAGAVVAYGSRRQECIALSSTEAEIMAASHCASEIMYTRGLLREMGVCMDAPTVLYVDNSGAVELSKDLKSCKRSRHIERRFLKVRELVAQGHIVVKYCPTEENHADVLTKGLPAAVHLKHATALMNLGDIEVGRNTKPTVRQRTFDVEAAYLKGEFNADEKHYARPPPGFRTFVRGDVPVVWKLKVPLYGEADAGRIWNRTLVKQLVRVQHFKQSQYDPCYFWKTLSDGTRMDLVMYVDDGYVIDAYSAAADAELEQLNASFKIDVKPAHFFLGNNIVVHDGSSVGAP